MVKHKIGYLLVGMFLILLLSACGSNDANDDNSGGEDGVTELTLWNTWTDEAAEGEVAKNRVEEFNDEHDDIEIVLETTAHDQYKTKLKTQAAGKQLPELIQVWPGAELEPIAEGGMLKPIDSIKDHWEDMIPDNVMEDYAYDGKQYAVPGTMSYTSIIYYDEDILKEAGYDEFPDSYNDFKQLITDLKNNGETPIELGNKEQWVLQSVYISTIADRFTGNDFLTDVFDGKAKFTDEPFVNALTVIDELNQLEAFNEDMNTLDDIQARDEFIQGNAAMMLSGSWSAGPIIESKPDDMNISVAIFPEIEGGEGNPEYVSGVSSIGIGLNSELNEKEEEAAHEFLKFFYSEEVYTEWIEDGLMVPANIDVPDDVDDLTKQVSEATEAGLAPVYDGILPAEITSIIDNGLQAITTGSTTPEDLAKEMQDEVDN